MHAKKCDTNHIPLATAYCSLNWRASDSCGLYIALHRQFQKITVRFGTLLVKNHNVIKRCWNPWSSVCFPIFKNIPFRKSERWALETNNCNFNILNGPKKNQSSHSLLCGFIGDNAFTTGCQVRLHWQSSSLKSFLSPCLSSANHFQRLFQEVAGSFICKSEGIWRASTKAGPLSDPRSFQICVSHSWPLHPKLGKSAASSAILNQLQSKADFDAL